MEDREGLIVEVAFEQTLKMAVISQNGAEGFYGKGSSVNKTGVESPALTLRTEY